MYRSGIFLSQIKNSFDASCTEAESEKQGKRDSNPHERFWRP